MERFFLSARETEFQLLFDELVGKALGCLRVLPGFMGLAFFNVYLTSIGMSVFSC